MDEMRSFRNLLVWQKAMTLIEEIYRVSAGFPREERFGLTAQVRKAGVSIASTLAKAAAGSASAPISITSTSRSDRRVKLKSNSLATRIGYLPKTQYAALQPLAEEVGRMLNGLINSMQPPPDNDGGQT